MSTYNRLPVTFERGEGVWLWDTQNNRYLDALGGVAVCVLGHGHPRVAEALRDQAGRLIHTSNLYGIANQEALADRLARASGMDRVFFGNSGAEANEAAIKLARLHGHSRGINTPEIVVADGSFHGRTLATLSATGNRKVQAGFEPLVQGFVRVPYGDLNALERVASNSANVAAVLLEPIQGEGGIVVPDENYLAGVRALCTQQHWLFMLDEIQTGIGRTGKWFAWQHHGCMPDVMSLAKGLGNGVPIGACLAHGDAGQLFQPGSHGSTFGGNPLACSAGLAVLQSIEQDNLLDNAARMGQRMFDGLSAALQGLECVREIRGRGLMIGIALDRPCGELVGRALDLGVLINVTAERVIRLLPPLIIAEAEVDQVVATVSQVVRDFCAER